MYDEQLEKLIEIALHDGVLTEKEKQVLFKKAESLGIDHDEFEMVLESRLHEKQQSTKLVKESSENPKSQWWYIVFIMLPLKILKLFLNNDGKKTVYENRKEKTHHHSRSREYNS